MYAWEGAHMLGCSKQLMQERMEMKPSLLETTGLLLTQHDPKKVSSVIYNWKAEVCYEGEELSTQI